MPLFDFIPMKSVVIDLVHLFLRISNVLTNLQKLIRSISDVMLLIKTLKEDYLSTEIASEIHRRIKQGVNDLSAI